MGKIVNSTFVSLDGVINHMERWHFDFIDGEADAFALEQLRDSDALLMGRHTYDVYASAWPGRTGEYPDLINAMPKYVASTTLESPEWANTTVLAGDLAEAVAKIKQDKSLLMHGYGPVAKALVGHGLLDELVLWVHPVLAGAGTLDDTLISHGLNTKLKLLGTRTLASGIVILSYRAN